MITGKHECPEIEGPVVVQGNRDDRYTLDDAIGEGTFSIVYRAKTESGNTVAIKRLKRHLQDHTCLRDEVQALVRIGDHQCDHVVQAFDAGLKDDRLSIVMEYFPHDDFASAFQRGAF
jgi:serine/threonine protein kinase